MSKRILVVGSIGLDTVETPAGKAEGVLGGSATYFSAAASLFSPVDVVGVVGEDFDMSLFSPLRERGLDLSGVEIRRGEKTFRWHGRYSEDMNERETIQVQLNCFRDFAPVVPETYREDEFVFLANGSPATQLAVLGQCNSPGLVAADTMDLWIETEREALNELIRRVDLFLLNDSEARALGGEWSVVKAAGVLLERGVRRGVVVKKGEHGSFLRTRDGMFALPAYPARELVDPTGAGDSFAGALLGKLAELGRTGSDALKLALAFATAAASMTCEGFSWEGLVNSRAEDVERRVEELERMTRFR